MHSPIARRVRAVSLAAILGAAVVTSSSGVESKAAIPTDDAAIVHALDRLTFGATVRDVERVKRVGLPRWIEEQLNPSTIDDSRIEARLAGFETLDLASNVIAREYERPARQERLRARRDQGDGGQAQSAPAGDPDRPARGRLSDAQMKNRLVLTELSEAKLLRAIYSERQLEEVLVDFWFNHFNVFAGKGQTRVYITEYERTAIRPHVLGRFRDLLEATAKSPAMLFYLDNWISSAPAHSTRLPNGSARSGQAGTQARLPMARRVNVAQPQPRTRGLNENYARELLELHTLGVDGGYTQTDIVNVARAFTGWTIRLRAARFRLRPAGYGGQVGGQVGGEVEQGDDMGFRFAPAMHDAGAKTVLGETIKAGGGEEDGERVLDILAAHPSTARFIATKLARRFVSDQPPQALVDRAAARFRATGGDLREVVRTIVTSPELFASEARGAKVKTPLEFVASALRATGADVERATVLTRVLRDLGMPSYFCQPPTGYDETAETWVSSGALVSRMNFAVDLTGGKLRGISVPVGSSDLTALRDNVQQSLLFGRASESTLATMARATTPAHTLALAIGSPEFQRR